MSYKPLRRDLTDSKEICPFCNKPLTSLKAYVLEEIATGKIVYAGPVCAQNNINANTTLSGIPDFTKFTTTEQAGGQGGGNGNNAINTPEAKRKRAMEYLELREVKVLNRLVPSYPILQNYYVKSQAGTLSSNDVDHILAIEKKAPFELKHTTLLKCYNYLFWLDIAIDQLTGTQKNYLIGIRNYIIKNKRLTQSQIDGTNKWLRKISGVPILR